MNTASIVANVAGHGFAGLCHSSVIVVVFSDIFIFFLYFCTLTLGSTDMPGTKVYILGSTFSVNTIFTGILCTILTKLPTAFSGGNKLDCAPDAICMLSTFPLKTLFGYASIFMSTL